MKHGSLFSGIGGFDLAAEWMGWENIFHCEWNPFGQKVLKHHFPKAISYEDITKTDFTIHANQIDILTGGFPCQPYSTAGKRKGKDDERHLFPQMLRAIKEIKPRWIVGENVRGLTNWNGGMVFHEVYDDLEREGYEVQSFLIPAAGVNAPHQRYRVWFIAFNAANTKINGSQRQWGFGEIGKTERLVTSACIDERTSTQNAKHTDCKGFVNGCKQYVSDQEGQHIGGYFKSNGGFASNTECIRPSGKEYRVEESGQPTKKNPGGRWQGFPVESPICFGNDGIPTNLDGITFPKWRNESIKAGGNAIVPQVALQIFKAIEQMETIFLPIHQNKV